MPNQVSNDRIQLIHNITDLDFERSGKHHYQLAFPLDSSWGYSLVPLTVVNGLRQCKDPIPPGVAVFGGTHGNEWEGQIAVKRLCADLAPEDICGRVILLPQLSESACRANQRISPIDEINMNRAFPGNSRGSLSSRIANFTSTAVFPNVAITIDVHSGGNEAAFPLCTSLHPMPDRAQYEETLNAARLFDTPFIFVYSRQMASGLLTDLAEDEGKISIGGEFGYGAGVSAHGVKHAYHGTMNVLRHYGLALGEVTKIDAERSSPPRVVSAPSMSDYIPCPCDAVWELAIQPGADVRKGDVIGYLHNFTDHTSAAIQMRAHRDGVLIAAYYAATCAKGATLYVVGEDVS